MELSFGDVPFLVLKSSNEKNRKGSTVPLRSDLAAELREWCVDKDPTDAVFNVPAGLLRILNRDLVAAGIDKVDENDGRVHLHAMRHSDIALTMDTYTDERFLETSVAVELLPESPIEKGTDGARTGYTRR